jgi:type IV pilus assembly protein PilC
MLFSSSKCPLPALVIWCRALKHSLAAGLDPVKIFKQQGKSGPRALRPVAQDVAKQLAKGSSLEDAFEPYRNRFPPLFLEMVAVGEKSGRLEATFDELSNYYETAHTVQRDFRAQMAYPAIQFVALVLIISGLIFVLGILGSGVNVLGLGFKGTGGAITFLLLAFGLVGVMLFALKLTADNVKWRCKLEGMALVLPAWGPALLNFALHRFCVALQMTHEAGLKAEKVLHYCFRASANSAFQRGEARAVVVVKKGGELHEALRESGAPFPEEFCAAIEVAEITGQITEVTDRLGEQYREEAARRMKQAAQFTTWIIYGLMCLLIILAIFGLAMQIYINPINEATKEY